MGFIGLTCTGQPRAAVLIIDVQMRVHVLPWQQGRNTPSLCRGRGCREARVGGCGAGGEGEGDVGVRDGRVGGGRRAPVGEGRL